MDFALNLTYNKMCNNPYHEAFLGLIWAKLSKKKSGRKLDFEDICFDIHRWPWKFVWGHCTPLHIYLKALCGWGMGQIWPRGEIICIGQLISDKQADRRTDRPIYLVRLQIGILINSPCSSMFLCIVFCFLNETDAKVEQKY